VIDKHYVAEASQWLQRGIKIGSSCPQAGIKCLLELLGSAAAQCLHPCHQVLFDTHLALVALSSAAHDHDVTAKHSMAALQLLEKVVPLGTSQLATLYTVHGRAIQQLIKEKSFTDTAVAKSVARQSVAALQAAYKIQGSCFGTGHPLVRASQKLAAESAKLLLSHDSQ